MRRNYQPARTFDELERPVPRDLDWSDVEADARNQRDLYLLQQEAGRIRNRGGILSEDEQMILELADAAELEELEGF